MRSIIMTALLFASTAATASAQALAGGPQVLDCRPISTQQSEKGVSVTRSFRAKDLRPVGTLDGFRCYAAPQPAPVQPANNDQTIVILNGFGGVGGFNGLTGLNIGTSPNVLGAPQPRRF
ncbi:MAG: hypothetical protein AAGJ32_08460 [Pseudomonadota bacterium]